MSERSTGGNQFADRLIDLAAITVVTQPTRDGRLISVDVSGDLAAAPSVPASPTETEPEEGQQ